MERLCRFVQSVKHNVDKIEDAKNSYKVVCFDHQNENSILFKDLLKNRTATLEKKKKCIHKFSLNQMKSVFS